MPARLSYPRKRVSSNRRRRRWNTSAAAYWIVRPGRTMTVEFAVAAQRQTFVISHQYLAGGCGFRPDPPVEQIEIDIAAAHGQSDPLAANFCLVLQRGRERRGAGAFGQI